MSNQFRCLTCARLGDGSDSYAVKLRSDEGEVIDGTSSKELTPDEYYGLSGVKVIQRTQSPRPQATEQPKASAQNQKVSDISTESLANGGQKPVVPPADNKVAPKKALTTHSSTAKTVAPKKTASKKAGKKK